jgi:hypothetical protein
VKNGRECLHEAIDSIGVYASFRDCQTGSKKAKIRATLIVMLHPFSSPEKAPNSSSVSLETGASLRGGIVLERLLDGNNF